LDRLSGGDVVAGTPICFSREAIEVLFNKLLSPREPIASAHGGDYARSTGPNSDFVNPKQNAPDSFELWDVKSNSPPPKPAQSQSTKWWRWCEWPNPAIDPASSEGPTPGVTTTVSTSVTPRAGHCASRKNKGKSCLMMQRLWSEQDGQDIAKYAVMMAVILMLVAATVRLIGSNATNTFAAVGSSITQ
jgi:Flp pilus assembly pilin Flp